MNTKFTRAYSDRHSANRNLFIKMLPPATPTTAQPTTEAAPKNEASEQLRIALGGLVEHKMFQMLQPGQS